MVSALLSEGGRAHYSPAPTTPPNYGLGFTQTQTAPETLGKVWEGLETGR